MVSRDWITSSELARIVGVHDRTMRLWIASGQVVPDRRTLGGHAQFTRASARRLSSHLKRRAGRAAA